MSITMPGIPNSAQISSELVTALGADRWFLFTHLLLVADSQGLVTETQQHLAQQLHTSRYSINRHLQTLLAFRWDDYPLVDSLKDGAGRIRALRVNARWQSAIEIVHQSCTEPHQADTELLQPVLENSQSPTNKTLQGRQVVIYGRIMDA